MTFQQPVQVMGDARAMATAWLSKCLEQTGTPEWTDLSMSVLASGEAARTWPASLADDRYDFEARFSAWSRRAAHNGWGRARLLPASDLTQLATVHVDQLAQPLQNFGAIRWLRAIWRGLLSEVWQRVHELPCIAAAIGDQDTEVLVFRVDASVSTLAELHAELELQDCEERAELEQKAAAEQRQRPLLRQRTQQLRREIEVREAAERQQDELIATLSHELRTPLTSLRGFAELLTKRAVATEKQADVFAIMHREANRMGNMLDEFLDLRRLEQGFTDVELEAVDVFTVIEQQADLFRTRGQLVQVSSQGAPRPAIAQANRLAQIFVNLLSNATKYARNAEPVDVTINFEHGSEQIRITFVDRGIGIAPEHLDRIFDKFYRVDNSDTRDVGGTGLGLAIVKDYCTAFGGELGVESELNVGSRFFVTLPAGCPE